MSPIEKQFKILYDLIIREKPQKADVIIWLQGDRYDRAQKIFKLYKEGWAKKIIISGNDILIGNKTRTGENNISPDKMKDFLLKKGIGRKSILIDDDAMNTKEQAEHILKLALDKKWPKLILVGSSYYQPRAFLTFLKQAEKIKWAGEIINQPVIIALNRKPAGRDKNAKIFLDEEFKKIEKYHKDLVLIEKGIEYLNKKKFSLRKAVKNDVRLLFKWANNPSVRSSSTNSKSITWKEHIAWFADKLSDPYSYIYILFGRRKNIGVVRFKRQRLNFTISYSIVPRYRGQGFGELILRMGMNNICNICKNASFTGYVREGNIASEKIFFKLGFIFKKAEIINNVKFNIYEKRYE